MLRMTVVPVLAGSLVALCLASCACGGSNNDGGIVDAGVVSLIVGTPDTGDEGFTPVASGSPLELYVGQQGSFFARLRYAVPGTVAMRCEVRVHIDIEGLGALNTWTTRAFEEESAYGPLTETHMILFNSLVDGTGLMKSDVPGRAVTITVNLTDANGATASAVAEAILRDDDPCIDCGGGLCLLPGDPNGCSFPPFPGLDAGTDSSAAADSGADSGT